MRHRTPTRVRPRRCVLGWTTVSRPKRHADVDVRVCRVHQRHALQHPPLTDAGLHGSLSQRKVRAGVDANDVAGVVGSHGVHKFTARPEQGGKGGQVQLAVGRGRQEGERVPKAIGAQSVNAAVDLGDNELLRCGVALFHDGGHTAVVAADDAAKTGLYRILDGQQRHSRARLFVSSHQPRDGGGRDERGVTVHH